MTVKEIQQRKLPMYIINVDIWNSVELYYTTKTEWPWLSPVKSGLQVIVMISHNKNDI